MIVSYRDRQWCGSVADLRGSELEPGAVVAAIRGEVAPCGVFCSPPGPLFQHVGHVHAEMGLRLRTALARAARSRGAVPSQQSEIERLQAERAALSTESTPPQRATAPETSAAALRERVAELRGRVQALESCGEDASEAREQLRAAAARLSEAETSRIAAGQSRSQARAERDRRERRLRLEDQIANQKRDARAELIEAVRTPFEQAVFALDPAADPFDPPPVVGALAVLRIARQRAPTVLATDTFPSPGVAADWIGGPVIRCHD